MDNLNFVELSRNEKTDSEAGSNIFFSNLSSVKNKEANSDSVTDPTFHEADSCDGEISWLLGEPNNNKGKHKEKNPISEKQASSSKLDYFGQPMNSFQSRPNNAMPAVGAGLNPTADMVKRMIYYAAVFKPLPIETERVEKKRKRKNEKISKEPQTVAARIKRQRVNERIRVLKRLVPGGAKMDTASMLDEAANYLKFLKAEIKMLESLKP